MIQPEIQCKLGRGNREEVMSRTSKPIFYFRICLLGLSLLVIFVTSYFGIHRNLDSALYKSLKNHQSQCKASIAHSTSLWVNHKHQQSADIFWTAENADLSSDTASWWISLQGSRPTNMKDILRELHSIGVPTHFPGLNSRKNDSCVTCAVVGNSANLIESGYGKVIDSHDNVIRFNKAPTVGFQRDVGSKTTHRMCYPESASDLSMGASLVLVPFKPLDVKWLASAITTGHITKTYRPVKNLIKCNISTITIVNPEFLRYTHKVWLNKCGRYPSTGITGVVMALNMCDQVRVFGFGADKSGGWQHYWEHLQPKMSLGFKVTGVHDGDAERALLNQLHQEGIIDVYEGAST